MLWGNPKVIHWNGIISLWAHHSRSIQAEFIITCAFSIHRSLTGCMHACACGQRSRLLLAVRRSDVTAVAGEPRVLCCWHHGKITSPSSRPGGELPSHSFYKPSLLWLINTPPPLPSSCYKPPDPELILAQKMMHLRSFHGVILFSQRSQIN